MRILIAHPGTQHAFKLANQLDRQGFDVTLATGIAFRPEALAVRGSPLLPTRVRKFIASQTFHGSRRVVIQRRTFNSLAALVSNAAGNPKAILHRNLKFQEAVVKRLARDPYDLVIGFDTSSHVIADACSAQSIPFILDQTIAPHPAKLAVIESLATCAPEWQELQAQKSAVEIANETFEMTQATHVVAPSSFTKDAVIQCGVPAERISVVPFGVDHSRFARPASTDTARHPTRYLFVGSVTARKGVPTLLAAWRDMRSPDRELVIAGSATSAIENLLRNEPGVDYRGRLTHADVAKLMASCDVFVFPSLCEGLALVLLEALSSGLPVISTREAGASDLIEGRDCGEIVPANDRHALAAAMSAFGSDAIRLDARSSNAVSVASSFGWDSYGTRWRELIDRLFTPDRRGSRDE